MIPVEKVRPGHVVRLPQNVRRTVLRVEHYDDGSFVVVYRLGDLEKTMRVLRAGDLVDVVSETEPDIDPGAGPDSGDLWREAQTDRVLQIVRSGGPMPDSEIVDRYREREADAGEVLTSASTIERRRRDLERRGDLVQAGERFHVETGRTEPVWSVKVRDEPMTIAREYAPEPDL